jgi:hypothetical protein
MIWGCNHQIAGLRVAHQKGYARPSWSALGHENIACHVSAASVSATMIATLFIAMGTAGHCMAFRMRGWVARRCLLDLAAPFAVVHLAERAVELGGTGDLLPVDIQLASDGNARQWRK